MHGYFFHYKYHIYLLSLCFSQLVNYVMIEPLKALHDVINF